MAEKNYSWDREKHTIDNFPSTAQPVPGGMTLNELNALSDKGLVMASGSGEDILSDIPVIIEIDGRGMTEETPDNITLRYLKGGYSDLQKGMHVPLKTYEPGTEMVSITDGHILNDESVNMSVSVGSSGLFQINCYPDGTLELKPDTTPDPE